MNNYFTKPEQGILLLNKFVIERFLLFKSPGFFSSKSFETMDIGMIPFPVLLPPQPSRPDSLNKSNSYFLLAKLSLIIFALI